ncbi:MAG: HD domain-containing protein [Acidobacteriota bacterium]
MVYTRDFAYLEEKLITHLSDDELYNVQRAYEVAEKAHTGQRRDEGTAYIVHPVRVAVTLVDELDMYSPKLICSALLHDVIEDSPTTRAEIAAGFGEEIAEIVWLLTKFEDVSLAVYLEEIEAAHHTGAPIVKLCDRLDNLRFISHSPKLEKKYRYADTTEKYYLPMAQRTNAYLYRELNRALDALKIALGSE